MAQELGATTDNPSFSVENSTVVIFYDTPHLFKSMRNNLLVKNLLLNDKIISFKYIEDLYHADLTRTPRLAPHLIKKAIHPNTFERMNVKLATQTFSRTTAKAIETNISMGSMPIDASPTAEFINLLDQLFDVFNSRFITDNGKPFRSALTGTSDHWSFLDKMQNLLKQIKFIPKSCFDPREALESSKNLKAIQRKPPCINGLVQNITALRKLWSILSEEYSFTFLRTNRLNQDPLENEFSCARRACGNIDTPNAQQFGAALKYSCIKKNLSISNMNCENDNSISIAGHETELLLDEKDPLAECDDFVVRPFDPLEENRLVPDVLETNALLYVIGYAVSKLKHKKCIKKLSQPRSNDIHQEYTFCTLKQYSNSENFIFPNKNALEIGLDLLNAFKQKFSLCMKENRKGLKQRLREYVEYQKFESFVCIFCFDKVINRLLNTLIKSEIRKIQQSLKCHNKIKRSGKARRLGIPSKFPKPNLHNRKEPIQNKPTSSSVRPIVEEAGTIDTEPIPMEFVSCSDGGDTFDSDQENVVEKNNMPQQKITKQSIIDPETKRMNDGIEALEKVLQLMPEPKIIHVEKRDCCHLTTEEITNTFLEFKHDLTDLFNRYKTFSSHQLAKIKTLASFEEVSGIFTEDQLYKMMLYLDSQFVSSADRDFTEIIDTVLIYEWGIRIFVMKHNFPNRDEALHHIQLQENAEIYS